MKDPCVIDPPGFDQTAAWGECREYVEKCGGLSHEDGSPNWRAAFGADPGVCACPSCGEYFWAWGRVQRCTACLFEYPVDWWPAYSEGTSDGRLLAGDWRGHPDFRARAVEYAEARKRKLWSNPYYRFGFTHPVADAWWHHDKIDWRFVLSNQGADMYTPSERVSKQLASAFRYHPAVGNQAERYARLREEAGRLAHLIACNTPESREQSIALTKLEEVVMFANAAIARNEDWDGNTMVSPLAITVEKQGRA